MWLGVVIIVAVLGLIVWATTRKSKLGHWARIAVMCLSGGFVFPHVLSEDEDLARHDAAKGVKAKK